MNNYVITYRPFLQSTLTASDIIMTAETKERAKEMFEQHCPQYIFVEAREQ